MINLRHLQAFVFVAEEQHFSRAAERAFVSPATMSGRIKEFERALGYEVFHRTSRHVELTPKGATLLGFVRDSLALLDEGFSQQPAMSVRVISTPDVQPPAILSAIHHINDQPFNLGYGIDLGRALLEDRADLAVTWSSPSELGFDGALIGEPIATVDMFAVVAVDDELASLDRISASQLEDREAVLFGRSMSPGPFDTILAFLGRPVSSVGIMAVHSQAGMAAKMLDHPGSFTFGSTSIVAPNLKAIPLDPPQSTTYWALARPGDEALIERFLTYVAEY